MANYKQTKLTYTTGNDGDIYFWAGRPADNDYWEGPVPLFVCHVLEAYGYSEDDGADMIRPVGELEPDLLNIASHLGDVVVRVHWTTHDEGVYVLDVASVSPVRGQGKTLKETLENFYVRWMKAGRRVYGVPFKQAMKEVLTVFNKGTS